MSRFRRVAGRVRRRLQRALPGAAPSAPVQRRWDAAAVADFEALKDEYRLVFQTMASATVASWEVSASELHRRLKPRLGVEEAATQIERFSDALVPSLSVLQTTERGVSELWPKVEAAGAEHDSVAQALALLAAHSRGLGRAFEEDWPKTVEYLGPVLDVIAVSDAGRQELLEIGAAVRRGLDSSSEAFGQSLAGVAVADRIAQAFLEATDGYRHGAAREVEMALHKVEQVIVRAADAD